MSVTQSAPSAENIPPNSQESRQELPPITSYDEKTVSLHRGQKGFGFVLRGAKSTSPVFKQSSHELINRQQPISLQYLDEIESSGIAEAAGLRKGDFLTNVNGVDVRTAAHEFVVQLIRQSGDRVTMTVATPIYLDSENESSANKICDHKTMSTSSFSSARSNTTSNNNNNNNIKDYSATIPRGFSASGESRDRSRTRPPPAPPKRDPSTTLSVGRARARSLCVRGEEDDRSNGNDNSGCLNNALTSQENNNLINAKVGKPAEQFELVKVNQCYFNNNDHLNNHLYTPKYNLSSSGYFTIRNIHTSSSINSSSNLKTSSNNNLSHVHHNNGGIYNTAKIASIRSRNFRNNYISNNENDENSLPIVYENHRYHYSVPDHGQYNTVKAGDEYNGKESVRGKTLLDLKKSRKLKKMKEFRSTPDISNCLYKDQTIINSYQVC